MGQLRARGKNITVSDELGVLFRSLGVVKDEVFRYYMARKQETYDENDASTFTIDQLLRFSQNKYTNRTDSSNYV